MNFQAVRQANGQNVTLSAVVGQVGPTTFIPSGTPKQECFFTDANDEGQKVTIWQGNGQPLPVEKVGLTLSLTISYKAKYKRFGGFWNSNAKVAPLTQDPPPQQAQQLPPQAAQPSNAPPQGGNAVSIRKSVVCAYLMGGKEPELGRVVYWGDYIATGNAPLPPAKKTDNQPEVKNDYDYDPQSGPPF